MLFDWDENKSERNLRERGFDFEFAAHVFDDETEDFADRRDDYGEDRIVAFGRIEGRALRRGLHAARRCSVDHLGIPMPAEGVGAMETTRGRALGPGRVDRARVAATTEADTRRHLAEDGFDPDNPLAGFRPVLSVAAVRRKTGLSQDKFATALRIPVGTVRNWEQGRSIPDPAAQALLALVDDDPERAFRVLAG